MTHDDKGDVKKKLPIIGKVSIGEAPDDDRPYPKPLDHFVLKQRKEIGNDVKWVQDDELMRQFDEQLEPSELPVTMFSNTVEENLRSSLQWWKSDHLHCYGNGETGNRWDDSKEERYEMDCTCEKFDEGLCKPNGQLRFSILSEEAQIGGAYAFYTTSSQTIRQLYTNLKSIKKYTATENCPNGRLRGLPLRLKLNPSETKFKDNKGKTRKTVHYFPYLSFHPSDLENSEIIDILKDNLSTIDKIDSGMDNEDDDFEDVDVNEIVNDGSPDEEIVGDFIE